MPRLQNDPNLNICPDFASPDFADARARLTNDGMTEEQSIILLRTVWEATNDAAKSQWQVQVETDKEQRDALQRRNQEEQDRKEQQRLEEDEAAHKEERKRNKHKYIPIQDCGVPLEGSIVPSSYATRKLEKGEFVELWYFTNEGLEEARSKRTIDDDAMIMSKLLDGSTAWVSASSMRNARSVVDDQDISFENFCQASPHFISAIETAGWPKDRVKMMALFWRNLQVHDYRSLRDPLAQKALLLYQAEQRKRWHLAVKSVMGPYDLSRINETLLERTRTQVYWDERDKKDNDRDYKSDQRMMVSASIYRREPRKRSPSPEHARAFKKPRQDFRPSTSSTW